jgi:hypothetical protein
METLIDVLRAIHLNMLEVLVAGLFIFGLGYRYGANKVRKLNREIAHLQNDVLELNAEILYGKEDQGTTPVIEIKHDALKTSKMAK